MREYDVIVLGAGAAGMTAAFVAAREGARVLLAEKTPFVGGTTSRAAGTLWVPGNYTFGAAEAREDVAAARRYLDALVGEAGDASLRERYLACAPAMVDYLRTHSAVRFNPCPRHMDYHPEVEGARRGGRPVEPAVYDGRRLGADFGLIRRPLEEFMVFGGMMVSKADIDALLGISNSFQNIRHAATLALRYAADRLRYPRGTRLTMGNALCGMLLKSVRDAGVTLITQAETLSISRQHVVTLRTREKTETVKSERAIIFAGGGFSGNAAWRERHMPKPAPQRTAAAEANDAGTMELALSLGGTLGAPAAGNAFWFPVSTVPRADGTSGVFPHIVMDRAKPGLIAVDARGRRFVNEGGTYHAFGSAMYAAGAIPCWLVCDHRFIRRYGLGAIRPGGYGLSGWVERGYVARSASLAELARAIGVDPDGLQDSARRMTSHAASGHDPDFGKGADPLSRHNGDPAHQPNPCLGPIDAPPFYAVRIEVADLGTSLGLRTDSNAQLVDGAGNTLPGLYACGNDMNSIMGGQYPGPGVTLGPAMTFGYLAALHAIGRDAFKDREVLRRR